MTREIIKNGQSKYNPQRPGTTDDDQKAMEAVLEAIICELPGPGLLDKGSWLTDLLTQINEFNPLANLVNGVSGE